MSALAVMVHSYELDVDVFARGEIPAYLQRAGDQPLLASRPLPANDLGAE